MARGGVVEWGRVGIRGGGWKWCSYKRTTIVVCCINLVAAIYVLRSIYSSFYFFSSSSSPITSSSNVVKFTDDQIRRMEESIRLRQASQPIQLVQLAKQLKAELSREGWELSQPMKQKLANEILQRLKGLKPNATETEQREAVEIWRAEKLEEAKKISLKNATFNSTISAPEAKMLTRVLEFDWLMLLEEIGFWMPAEIINKENNEKPENELEEEIIPGQPLPPECHPELHTDYDGAAVKWGLTHHKESAADCCQACLDQAKRTKPGELKCNIWVYCPSETGCFSPDIYEHKHQECWLKHAENPRLNFKDKYSESYRSSHPTAPVIVPWMSGVVRA